MREEPWGVFYDESGSCENLRALGDSFLHRIPGIALDTVFLLHFDKHPNDFEWLWCRERCQNEKGTQRATRPFDELEDDFLSTSQSIVDIFPDGANPADMHPPLGLDYRSVMPSSEEDMEDIQAALSTTKVQYLEEIGHPCPPTTRHRCYFSQLDEVLDNQFTH